MSVIVRVIFVFLLLGWSLAFAQTVTEDDPLMGSEAETPILTSPDNASTSSVQQILVIGDNLAGGMGAGLSRLGAPIAVTNRFNEVSGLARPDFYDWPQAVAKITQGKNFDAAVIMIGVNDRREFRSGSGRFAFGTSEWKQAYAAQVDALIATLRTRNIKTYWVGLPPMADPDFDNAVQDINAIAKTRSLAAGANYIDFRADFLNADGSYSDRGLDESGASRKMRARDGVTFFKLGNTKMARLVLNAITNSSAVSPVAPQATLSDPAPAVPASPAGPQLGESGNSGEIILTDVKDIKIIPVQSAATTTTATPPIKELLRASPSSASERMFSAGEPPVAPAGRFDDFIIQQ
jgi:uncharacterized protein